MARLKIGFIPIEGGHYYKEALHEVTRAEELGFDSVWMEEHHAVTNHYWPSPLTVLAGYATRTSRISMFPILKKFDSQRFLWECLDSRFRKLNSANTRRTANVDSRRYSPARLSR